MSNKIRAVLALSLFAVVAACAQQEEPVYAPEPVQQEPVFTGKYG